MFVEFENNIVNVKNIVCLYHESLEGKDSTLVMFIKIDIWPLSFIAYCQDSIV